MFWPNIITAHLAKSTHALLCFKVQFERFWWVRASSFLKQLFLLHVNIVQRRYAAMLRFGWRMKYLKTQFCAQR